MPDPALQSLIDQSGSQWGAPAPEPANPTPEDVADRQQKARDLILQHSDNPKEDVAKLDSSQWLAPRLGLDVSTVWGNHDQIRERMYDSQVKPTTFWERLKNSGEDFVTRREINALSTLRFFGDESQNDKIQLLKEKLHPAEKTIKEFPKQVMGSLVDLGIQLGKGIEGMVAGGVGAVVGGTLLGPIGMAAGGFAGGMIPIREQFDNVVSSQFDAMMDWKDDKGKGVNPTVARGVSLGMGAVMTALNFVKVGEIPGVKQGGTILEKALVKAAMKIGLTGKMGTFVASTAGMSLYSAAASGANMLGIETAKVLTNEENVPKATVSEWMSQLGLSAAAGAVSGAPLVGLGLLDAHGLVTRELDDQISKIPPESGGGVPTEAPQARRIVTESTPEGFKYVYSHPERPGERIQASYGPGGATIEDVQAPDKKSAIINFLKDHAGERVDWQPKTAEDVKVRDQIRSENPRRRELEARIEDLKARLSVEKDPEVQRMARTDLSDFRQQLANMDLQWFASDKPEDQNVGDTMRDEEPFQLEQPPEESPQKAKPPESVQETFGFANKTPAEIADDAQQMRMFEEAAVSNTDVPKAAAEVQIQSTSPEVTPKDSPTGDMAEHPTTRPIQEVPITDIHVQERLPNMKEGVNEKGIKPEDAIQGKKYDRDPARPIIVYQFNDGTMEVATGRHRFEFAQRVGEKTIPAQIYREADGWTPEDMAFLDAKSNIQDGRGSVKDYARVNKKLGLTEGQAFDQGLLGSARARQGFAIGTWAEDDLYTLYRNDKITAEKAAAIASAAPLDAALQRKAIGRAKDLGADELVNYINAIKYTERETGQVGQGSLWGADEPAMVEAEKLEAAVTEKQHELAATRRALSSALSLSKENAKKVLDQLGWKTAGTKEEIKARIAEMDDEILRWAKPWNDPPLMEEARSRAKLAPAVVREPTPEVEAVRERPREEAAAQPEKAAAQDEQAPRPRGEGETQRPAEEAPAVEREPVTADQFKEILTKDPGYERAQAEINSLQDRIAAEKEKGKTAVAKERVQSNVRLEKMRQTLKAVREKRDAREATLKSDYQMRVDRLKQAVNRAVETGKEDVAAVKAKESMRRQNEAAKEMRQQLERGILQIDPKSMRDEYRLPAEDIINKVRNMRTGEDPLGPALDQLAATLEKDKWFPLDSQDRARLKGLMAKNLRQLTIGELQDVHDLLKMYDALDKEERRIETILGQKTVEAASEILKTEARAPQEINDQIQRDQPAIAEAAKKAGMGVQEFFWQLIDDPDVAIQAWFKGNQDSVGYDLMSGKLLRIEENYLRDLAERSQPIADFMKKNKLNWGWWHQKVTVDLGDGRSAVIMRGTIQEMFGQWRHPYNRKNVESGYSFRYSRDPSHVQAEDANMTPEDLLDRRRADIQKIISNLTPLDKEWIAVEDEIYKKSGQAVDATHYELNKRHLRLEDLYRPVTRIPGTRGPKAEFDIALHDYNQRFTRAGVDKGHMKERTGYTGPIVLGIDIDSLVKHLDNVSTYVTKEAHTRMAGRVLYGPTYKAALEAADHGKRMYQIMDRNLKDFAGMREPYTAGEKLVSDLSRKGKTAILFLRPTTALINAALQFRGMIYAGFRDGVVGIAENTLRPSMVHKRLEALNPYYAQGVAHGFTREQAEIYALTVTGKAMQKAGKFGAKPVQKTTQWAIASEMNQAYHHAMRGLKDLRSGKIKSLRDFDPDVARAMADKEGNLLADQQLKSMPAESLPSAASRFSTYSVVRTHASSFPEVQSLMNKDVYTAQLAVFQSEFHAALGAVRRKAMDMKYTPGGWKRLVRTGIVLGLMEPTVIGAIRAMQAQALNRKKKVFVPGQGMNWQQVARNLGEEEVSQILGPLPGIGGAARSTMAMIEQGPFSPAAESSSFFLDQYLGVAKRLGYDTYQAFGGKTMKAREKAKKDLAVSLPDLFLSLSAGVSYRSISDYVQAFVKPRKESADDLGK